MFRTKVYKVVCTDASNRYILGRITGFMAVLSRTTFSKDRREFAIERYDDFNGAILRVRTTKFRYRLIRKRIEAHYPNLCKFEDI